MNGSDDGKVLELLAIQHYNGTLYARSRMRMTIPPGWTRARFYSEQI